MLKCWERRSKDVFDPGGVLAILIVEDKPVP